MLVFDVEMCMTYNSALSLLQNYLAPQLNRKHRGRYSAAQSFSNPKSAGSLHLIYLHNVQRCESHLAHLRYNVHQVHRRHNLANSAINRVPEVVLAARPNMVRKLPDSRVLHMIGWGDFRP
jgi:hypothetical protein